MRPTESSSEFGVVERIRRLPDRRFVMTAVVLGGFVVLATIATWPFVLHPASTLTAPLWGDVAGSVAKYEALIAGHAIPFFSTHFPWISYPQGPQNNVGVDRVSVFSVLYLWLVSDLLGAITAHSLMSFLGYVLTALVTFLFVRRLTGSALAGAIGGLAYGFCPTMFALAGSDMTYTQMWLFILPLWAFWLLAAQVYSRRRVAVAILSIVPAVFWTPYYTLHSLVVGSSCLAVTMVYLWRRQGWRLAVAVGAVTGAAWAVMMLAWRYVGLHTPSSIVPVRTLAQIYEQSAQPLMFIQPGKLSWQVGGHELLTQLVPRAPGASLYIGVSVLALAVVALVAMLKKRPAVAARADRGLRVAAIMSGVVASVCFLFSLPPTYTVGRFTVPMPGYLVAHTVPALRAGQRFVMPIAGCLAVLAGIGAWLILRRLRPRMQFVVAAGMLAVVGFDLWALPPHWTSVIATYPSLAALRSLPTAPVAQFDHGSLLNAVPQLPCLLQHEYDKPLINDCGLGRSADLGVILTLPLCEQITALQAMGTRYIILTPEDQMTFGCLSGLQATQRVVARDSTYEVVALKELNPGTRAAVKARLQLP